MRPHLPVHRQAAVPSELSQEVWKASNAAIRDDQELVRVCIRHMAGCERDCQRGRQKLSKKQAQIPGAPMNAIH